MSKKWFLTLIFPFLFVILSGFGTVKPQDSVYVGGRQGSDSLALDVNIKFNNPNVVVSDERDFAAFKRLFDEQKESDNAIANAITEISGYLPYMVENQERRYESAMDYLTRKSGYPANDIEKFIKQKRLSEIINATVIITCLLFLIAHVMVTIASTTMDWRIFLTKVSGIVLAIVLLYNTLEPLLHSFLFPESHRFYALMTLSG